MFCPKCGQEQADEVLNFCARCGLRLAEVAGLVERDGAPGEAREAEPPRDGVRRRGLRLLMAALAFFVLAVLSSRGNAVGALFAFLTVASFVIGSCVLIYSSIKGRMRRRAESAPLGQQTAPVQVPRPHALRPYAPPVGFPEARLETGETAQPPSVTENTTRHLEHAPPGEGEH